MGAAPSRPLYLLPFDQRRSFVREMFRQKPPLTADQTATVIDAKRVIYDGFRQAISDGSFIPSAGVLVDDEFGYGILRDARKCGYVTAVAIEKSELPEFAFEHGNAFASHIEIFGPSIVKALIHYDPESDEDLNARQVARLKRLSDYCQISGQRFMLELQVPGPESQRYASRPDAGVRRLWIRSAITAQSILALQDAGVEPHLWQLEGFDSHDDCKHVVAAAQRDGRTDVGCIVLARQADAQQVEHRLTTAASVDGFTGFAIGRPTYWNAVADYLARKTTRQEAVGRIALRYRRWAGIFERGYRLRPSAA